MEAVREALLGIQNQSKIVSDYRSLCKNDWDELWAYSCHNRWDAGGVMYAKVSEISYGVQTISVTSPFDSCFFEQLFNRINNLIPKAIIRAKGVIPDSGKWQKLDYVNGKATWEEFVLSEEGSDKSFLSVWYDKSQAYVADWLATFVNATEETCSIEDLDIDDTELYRYLGFDISRPAKNAKEAFQWLYFAYLAAIKTQNGAAMSVGRVSTFLDIYIERDMANGVLTEKEAQELVDHITMKFRMVKFARIESYNQLFSGDPVWATVDVAGIGMDGRSQVTKTCFRFLHTLENMGPSPEPNLTVLYSSNLPEAFKKYAAHISIATSSVQYENDDVMRPVWGDDYSVCCCVSATETGKEIQFFGARANLAKCLLYAINGGVDEKTKEQVGPKYRPITSEYLDYDEVMEKYDEMMEWLSKL